MNAKELGRVGRAELEAMVVKLSAMVTSLDASTTSAYRALCRRCNACGETVSVTPRVCCVTGWRTDLEPGR